MLGCFEIPYKLERHFEIKNLLIFRTRTLFVYHAWYDYLQYFQ